MGLNTIGISAALGQTRHVVKLVGDVCENEFIGIISLSGQGEHHLGCIARSTVDVHLGNDHTLGIGAIATSDGHLLAVIGLTFQDKGIYLLGTDDHTLHAVATRDSNRYIGVGIQVGSHGELDSHFAATLRHVKCRRGDSTDIATATQTDATASLIGIRALPASVRRDTGHLPNGC